ncbi:MAG: 3-keto-5-aminohexanoate cleavage protein, partial [Cyanobacteria bacterium SZAS LIN-5]|nr:3-keto-5-aminohexanoate cleavage protein [Cyanobacteria bacterium SZAS LIN-5]
MYFTDDSLLPENQTPLIITAAPYGPVWLPSDYPEDIAVTWDQQVQKAVDCYNAGATILHIHVRDPKTGKVSKNFKEYGEFIGRLREAVPKMILQVGGSISFSPPDDHSKAQWQGYDTRHMLAELDPKPDQITVAIGSCQWDITSLTTMED